MPLSKKAAAVLLFTTIAIAIFWTIIATTSMLRWMQMIAWGSVVTFLVTGIFLSALGRIQSQRSSVAERIDSLELALVDGRWPNRTQLFVLWGITVAAWTSALTGKLSPLDWVQNVAWISSSVCFNLCILFLLLLMILDQRRLHAISAEEPESARKAHGIDLAYGGPQLFLWSLINYTIVAAYVGAISEPTWEKIVFWSSPIVVASFYIPVILKNRSVREGPKGTDRGMGGPTPAASLDPTGS